MIRLFVFIPVVVLCFSCNQKNPSGRNNKLVLGSTTATVTTTPGPGRRNRSVGVSSAILSLQKGDTVEVKIEVHHRLFEVKRGVIFTAWVFGDSLPARAESGLCRRWCDRQDAEILFTAGLTARRSKRSLNLLNRLAVHIFGPRDIGFRNSLIATAHINNIFPPPGF